jgi:peptidyl-prolyl cis-trans isomerase SurA
MNKPFLRIWIVGLAWLASATVHPAYEELEGIVAIVEDDVVLASELRSRLAQVRQSLEASDSPIPPNDIIVSQLMERLIIENLQLQEANKRGVEMDDETVTRGVQQLAASNNLTIDQFRNALAADGIAYREFREDLRAEMTISQLQRSIVNRRISITEQDIDGLLNSPFYKQLFSDEYRVGHIMLTLEAGSSDLVVARASEEAQKIVNELREGADFAQTAMRKSSASTALEGGDLGWRRAGELPTLFTETVLEMQVGEIAEPINTSGSIHIIKLLEQRGAGTETEQQTMVSHILVQPSEIRTDEEAEALISEVASRIAAGDDFAALAVEYSEDPGSALNGGELGWSTADAFVGMFAQTMQKTAIGQFSEPFLSQFGWHILHVADRREQDMSDEARREKAVQVLARRRFDEELEEWIKELRDEAFVELRL